MAREDIYKVPAHCHVTHHVHVTELKEQPSAPYNTAFSTSNYSKYYKVKLLNSSIYSHGSYIAAILYKKLI